MYEGEPLLETCGHAECDTGWLRYCPIEGSAIEGDAGVVIDQIDNILYDTHNFGRSDFYYQGDEDNRLFARVFDKSNIIEDLTQVVGYRQQTIVSHERLEHPSRQVYQVVSEWYIPAEDEISGRYRTEYCIEQYPGHVVATVTEYDMKTESLLDSERGQSVGMIDRPMTSYDHEQLFVLLDGIRLDDDIEAIQLR